MCCELKEEELDPELKEILLELLSMDGLQPKDDAQLLEWVNRSPYRTLLNRPIHEFTPPVIPAKTGV